MRTIADAHRHDLWQIQRILPDKLLTKGCEIAAKAKPFYASSFFRHYG